MTPLLKLPFYVIRYSLLLFDTQKGVHVNLGSVLFFSPPSSLSLSLRYARSIDKMLVAVTRFFKVTHLAIYGPFLSF